MKYKMIILSYKNEKKKFNLILIFFFNIELKSKIIYFLSLYILFFFLFINLFFFYIFTSRRVSRP
jgi:hypothetical protein